MELPQRKPNRLPNFDDSTPGAYFITICAKDHKCIFGHIVGAAIPHFVSTFKRFCHKDAGMQLFQRSYHDHVIRGQKDYLKIWEYMENNPARWSEDCFYQE